MTAIAENSPSPANGWDLSFLMDDDCENPHPDLELPDGRVLEFYNNEISEKIFDDADACNLFMTHLINRANAFASLEAHGVVERPEIEAVPMLIDSLSTKGWQAVYVDARIGKAKITKLISNGHYSDSGWLGRHDARLALSSGARGLVPPEAIDALVTQAIEETGLAQTMASMRAEDQRRLRPGVKYDLNALMGKMKDQLDKPI